MKEEQFKYNIKIDDEDLKIIEIVTNHLKISRNQLLNDLIKKAFVEAIDMNPFLIELIDEVNGINYKNKKGNFDKSWYLEYKDQLLDIAISAAFMNIDLEEQRSLIRRIGDLYPDFLDEIVSKEI